MTCVIAEPPNGSAEPGAGMHLRLLAIPLSFATDSGYRKRARRSTTSRKTKNRLVTP
jgi:hypothetical protein